MLFFFLDPRSGITELVNPIKDSIHKEVAAKLTSTDNVVKEQISKLIRSRVTQLLA